MLYGVIAECHPHDLQMLRIIHVEPAKSCLYSHLETETRPGFAAKVPWGCSMMLGHKKLVCILWLGHRPHLGQTHG